MRVSWAKMPCSACGWISPRRSVTMKVLPWLIVRTGGPTLIEIGIVVPLRVAVLRMYSKQYTPTLSDLETLRDKRRTMSTKGEGLGEASGLPKTSASFWSATRLAGCTTEGGSYMPDTTGATAAQRDPRVRHPMKAVVYERYG